MRACELKHEVYDSKKIEAMYQNIVARSKTDNPQYYEIWVDDFPVVEKTSDPERFMDYSEFINHNTKFIRIHIIYSVKGASDKFYFHLQPNEHTKNKGLFGIPIEDKPKESEDDLKEKWRKEMHYEQLLEENEDLKEEIEELERTIEQIEEEKDNIKYYRDLTVRSALGFGFDGLMNSNTAKPFVDGVSGVNNPAPEETTKTENSFKRKSEAKVEPEDVESEEVEGVVLNEEDEKLLDFMRLIKQRVGSIELANVIHLLDVITSNPQTIHFAMKQVSNYLKQKPATKAPEENNTNTSEEETNF